MSTSKRVVTDWYGREGYRGMAGALPRSRRKKQLVREQDKYNWYWLRERGRHDIAHASNQQKPWGHRNWSLHDYPRKGWRGTGLVGKVARRLERERVAVHSHAVYAAEKGARRL